MNEQESPTQENYESGLDKLRQLSDIIDKETLNQLQGQELDEYVLRHITAANLRISERISRNVAQEPQEIIVYKGVDDSVVDPENRQPILSLLRQKGISYGEAIRERAKSSESWTNCLIGTVTRQILSKGNGKGETPFISATEEKRSAENFGDEVVSFTVPQLSVVPIVDWFDKGILDEDEIASGGGMGYMGISGENESMILVDSIPADRYVSEGPTPRKLFKQRRAAELAANSPETIEESSVPEIQEKISRWQNLKKLMRKAFLGS